MKSFLILSLSASDESISRLCSDHIRTILNAHGHQAQVVDIRDFTPFWINSDKLSGAPEEYRLLADDIRNSMGVFILSPVYCYSTSSITKLFSELYSQELTHKPVALITAASTLRSHLAVSDVTMNMVFEMETFVFPKSVQVTGDDVNTRQLSTEIIQRLTQLTENFAVFANHIDAYNQQTSAMGSSSDQPLVSTMKINHFNVTTANLDRSLRFYQDVLGVQYLRHLGKRKVITDFHGFEFFIEEVAEPVVDPVAHLGIRTDIDTVVKFKAHLKSLGVPLTKGNNPTADIHHAEDGYRTALYFNDPDGWLIEVYSPERQTLIDEGTLNE